MNVYSIAREISNNEFSIAHYADKRYRVYANDTAVSHMSGKAGKYVTSMNGASFDKEQAFNNIGKYMNDENGHSMEKWNNAERTANVTARYSEIVKHVADPIGTASEFAAYEDPMHYISTAMTIVNAIENGADDGTIAPLDGSCSGIQHMSAHTRDYATAAKVNLVASDTRRDIYIETAEFVKDNFKTVEDIEALISKNTSGEAGMKKAQKAFDKVTSNPESTEEELAEAELDFNDSIAKSITKGAAVNEAVPTVLNIIANGGVTRKVTKNPMMVLSYGSKVATTIKTVKAELAAAGTTEDPIVGLLIALAVEKARQGNAGSAMNEMTFLQNIVKATNKNGKVAEWSTGNGVVVNNSKFLKTNKNVRLLSKAFNSDVVSGKELDFTGMLASVAPNFIHSYDAAHLALTVNAAKSEGIDLVTIHDSFGTTPNNIVRLNAILREQFIAMYADTNPLAEMLEFNKANIDADTYVELEAQLTTLITGDYDVAEIAFNEFAFS